MVLEQYDYTKKGLPHPRPALCDAKGPGLIESQLEKSLVTDHLVVQRTHSGNFGYTADLVERPLYKQYKRF